MVFWLMTLCSVLGTNISEEYTASIFVAEVEVADSVEYWQSPTPTAWYKNPEHKTAVKTLNLTFIFAPPKSVLKPYEQTSFLYVSTSQQICMMCSE
jgi:hypothetical protein